MEYPKPLLVGSVTQRSWREETVVMRKIKLTLSNFRDVHFTADAEAKKIIIDACARRSQETFQMRRHARFHRRAPEGVVLRRELLLRWVRNEEGL